MLKKILATAIAAAMIFGLVSVAMAAAFTDTGGTPNEKAIVKLAALGLLKGYPDGTFKPFGNITRAEFAAVVVRALGYEASANLLTSPPVFPDCAGVPWAWGYINVASAQGIVKGYPDGTFGPQNNVTIAEAITMLVRALGRDEEAVGVWPTGHIMVASTLGMLPSDLPGVSVPATRGIVAQLVNNVLGKEIVRKNPTTGSFDAIPDPNTFLERNGAKPISNEAVTDVNTTDGYITFATSGKKYYASGVLFVGASTLTGLKGQKVDAILNSSDYVIYVGSTDTKGISGVVSAIDKINKTITVGGVTYTVKDTATVTLNGIAQIGDAVAKISGLKDAEVTLVLDAAGKVTFIEATKLTSDKTLTKKETVYTASGLKNYVTFDGAPMEVASGAKIIRNNAAATYADIQLGDSCRYATDAGGKIIYLDAYAVKVSGVLQEKSTVDDHTSYKIGDVVYKVATDSYGNDVLTGDETLHVKPGEVVTLTLDRSGKVTKVERTTTTTAAVTLQSKLEGFDAQGYPVQRLTLSDGTTVTLGTIAVPQDFTRNGLQASFADLKAGDILVLEYDNQGKVNKIKAFAPVSGTIKSVGSNAVDIQNSSGTVIASVYFKLNYSALVKNGVQTVVTVPANDFPVGQQIKVTSWNVTKTEQYANFIVRDFDETGYTVKGTSTVGQDTLLVLAKGDVSGAVYTYYLKVTPAAIVHRADAAIPASSVVIGDKVSFKKSAGDGTGTPFETTFLYATTDTSAPSFDTGKTPAAVSGTLSVTFNTNEDCWVSYKVYDSGGTLMKSVTAVEVSGAADTTITWDGNKDDGTAAPAGTYTIVLTFRDYAGNTADPRTVTVTK